jgi:hypothetical protein
MAEPTDGTTHQDQAQDQATQQGDQNAGTPAEAQNTDTPAPVPYDRFKVVNDELAELRKWRKAQEAEQAKAAKATKDAEAQRLTQQQEWQKLAEQRQAELDTLAAEKAQAEGRLREIAIRDAIRAEAQRQKLSFANDAAANDALLVLKAEGRLDELEIDDAGKAQGLDVLLKGLKEQRPYLFKAASAPGSIDAGARGNGQPQTSEQYDAQIRREFRIK